jgi:hypothetical protein
MLYLLIGYYLLSIFKFYDFANEAGLKGFELFYYAGSFHLLLHKNNSMDRVVCELLSNKFAAQGI